MKLPAIFAVMVLGAATVFAQAPATGASAAPAATGSQNTASSAASTDQNAKMPADHMACTRHKTAGAKGKACHCMHGKNAKMAGSGHKGMCPRHKTEAEKKS